MATRTSPSKKSTPRGEVKPELIRRALAIIERSGTAALTMREVASQVGVSPMAAYRHFENKDALLAALAEEGFASLDQTLKSAAASARDPLQSLESLCLAYVRFARSHPHHYTLMFGPELTDKESHPSLNAAAQSAFQALIGAVERCLKEKVLPPKMDALGLAVSIHSLVHGLSSLILDQKMDRKFPKDKDFDDVVRGLIQPVLKGLSALS